MLSEKICPKCEIMKPAADFYTVTSRHDGLSGYCRECQLSDAKARYEPSPRWKAPEGMKRCPKCDTIKPLDTFGANRTAYDGKQPYCKPCSVAAVTKSRHKDPTSHRASSKAWREKNADRHADNNAKWKYGVEHGTYAKMFEDQGGKCAICETQEPGAGCTRFPIDHCHDTGKVRGLLCNSCNNGIGRFKHDPNLTDAASRYLRKT